MLTVGVIRLSFLLSMLTHLSKNVLQCDSTAFARSNHVESPEGCCCSAAFLECGFLQWARALATLQSGWGSFHFKLSLALLRYDSSPPLTHCN